jgi:mannitol/fructose-specific phosphotransferase system IIA component (Ntr-type)
MEWEQSLVPLSCEFNKPFHFPMSILSTSLLPKEIQLHLRATDPRDALEELLSTLRSDHRVRDVEKLRAALIATPKREISQTSPCPMFLHHGRTESVSTLVLAVGRSAAGFTLGSTDQKTHLLIVAAIPEAMNNEYLRILGAISRVCREEETLKSLLAAEDTSSFLAILEKGCRQ